MPPPKLTLLRETFRRVSRFAIQLGLLAAFLGVAAFKPVASAAEPPAIIRVGIIGLDAHAVPWTRILTAPGLKPPLSTLRIVAAVATPSPDIPFSRDNNQTNTAIMRELGVEICRSIEELLTKVDAVLVLSIDGRPHHDQARPVFRSHKPVFIDKPVAASLADAIALFQDAEANGTPCFSNSALRYGPATVAVTADGKLGRVLGCATYSSSQSILPGHPDLFYYGIHGTDLLFTLMGPGCQSVRRVKTPTADVVTGVWADGRAGTYRGILQGAVGFGATAFCEKGVADVGRFEGYEPLITEIARFFATGKAPVSVDQTLEIYAFLEAADESARHDGAPVLLADILARARQQAAGRAGR